MNIRVNLKTNIADGSEVVFRSPADCSQVTGLVIYHNGGKTEFAFADAHGHNVGDIDHLFAENAVVKVILDVTAGMAFVQNADTNAYIERTFIKAVNGKKPDANGNVNIYDDAIGSAYVDVTAAYEQALADGEVSCAKEYLWSLGAGWYSITDKDTIDNVLNRYYLQALEGEKDIIGRILYTVGDFMFVEYYTEDRAYTEAPKFCLDGDGGVFFEGKTIVPPDGVQIDNGILHLIRDGKPVGQGVELPSGGSLQVSGAEVGQILKVKEVDENGVPTAWETADAPTGGGSGEWKLIKSVTTEELVRTISISDFEANEIFALIKTAYDSSAIDTSVLATIVVGGISANGYNTMNVHNVRLNKDAVNVNWQICCYSNGGFTTTWSNAAANAGSTEYPVDSKNCGLLNKITSLKIQHMNNNGRLIVGSTVEIYAR